MNPAALSYQHRFEAGTDGSLTLLLLHGTGGTEDDLVDLGRSLAPGAALLAPRGPVSEHGQARFFRRLAEGVFDLEDLARRTVDLAAFVAEAARAYGFDPRRVLALGFSNGANIAGSLVLADTGALAGAVLLAPMVPFVPRPLPTLGGLPIFVGAGRADPLVPVAGTEALERLLKDSGADVETFWHPGGHQLTRPELEAVRRWRQTRFPLKGDDHER